MLDKQISKKLEKVLNNMDQSKLSKVKDMIQKEENLVSLFQNLNTQKASEKLKDLDLGDMLNKENLNNILKEVKNNPNLLEELKKKL